MILLRLEEADRYHQFIERLREESMASVHGKSSAFVGTHVLSLDGHHGFGFAVKAALAEVKTQYVLVVQHDQEFIAGFDLPAVLETMSRHPEIVKYVGLSSASSDPASCLPSSLEVGKTVHAKSSLAEVSQP